MVPVPTAEPPATPEPTKPPAEVKIPAGSVAEAIADIWPFDDRAALEVAGCESTGSPDRWDPEAVNGQHLGLFQIASRVHRDRIAALGYTAADLFAVGPNVAVAADIYADSGWGPWVSSVGCHGHR